ncbi:hypothetical protein [Scatolibacter rhodanostii]|uniref:hypothetical protein n=1 Tax=Scatolibacter rhodanostii TaxID=2014781 RepID=UPI0013566C9B|nr:hypothetical protein [Scatolibacter rhodanostii]
MKQLNLTNSQAEILKEFLICTKSYRLGEIAYHEAKCDEKRAEPFRQIDQLADEIIPCL